MDTNSTVKLLSFPLLIIASLLFITACGDSVVDPPIDDDDDYEPIVGLEELQEIDGMWQGLESPGVGHDNTRRSLNLVVEDSLFYEAFENDSGCFLVTENKIVDAESNLFTIELQDGEQRDVRFEHEPDADRAKYINHNDEEFLFERSDQDMDDWEPQCD